MNEVVHDIVSPLALDKSKSKFLLQRALDELHYYSASLNFKIRKYAM